MHKTLTDPGAKYKVFWNKKIIKCNPKQHEGSFTWTCHNATNRFCFATFIPLQCDCSVYMIINSLFILGGIGETAHCYKLSKLKTSPEQKKTRTPVSIHQYNVRKGGGIVMSHNFTSNSAIVHRWLCDACIFSQSCWSQLPNAYHFHVRVSSPDDFSQNL